MKKSKIMTYFVLALFSGVWIVPLISIVLTSLKSEQQILYLPFWAIPSEIHFLENVYTVFDTWKLGGSFINTIFYSIASAAVGVFMASLIAFPLAKMSVKGKRFIFYFALVGTFLPFQMYLIPQLHMLRAFGIYNTMIGLWLVFSALAVPFATLVIRNYMSTIPDSLMDAAKLDGLSNFGAYRKIVLPLSMPGIVVAFLFQFIYIWNDMLFGLVLTTSAPIRPLMTQLAMLRGGYITSFGVMAAGTLASMIIPIVVILVFQEKFIAGFRAPV